MTKRESKKKVKEITTEEFDRKFDAGEDISDYIDWGSAIKRVNVDFPMWMIEIMDNQAKRLGIPRQALIKVWIDERINRDGLHLEKANAG